MTLHIRITQEEQNICCPLHPWLQLASGEEVIAEVSVVRQLLLWFFVRWINFSLL
jgi:hypothetical protein